MKKFLKIEESNEIPAESKATELAKQQEIKQKSQVALDKIIAFATSPVFEEVQKNSVWKKNS